MHWTALHWSAEALDSLGAQPLAWWALRFTPHVVWVEEALLLEASACLRLWGGTSGLRHSLLASAPQPPLGMTQAPVSLQALARLRLQARIGPARAAVTPVAGLPLHALSAARPHLPVLQGLGCRTWGQLDSLPRAGLARRFGPDLLAALDVALGRAPDAHRWARLPHRFRKCLELPQLATSASALLWAGRRLLAMLQQWLLARGLGVLALEFSWELDVRGRGKAGAPARQSLCLRTARAVQSMEHLQRLLNARLERTVLPAPARNLCLRVLETEAMQLHSHSLLPAEGRQGLPLHMLVERVQARLGAGSASRPCLRDDHRPEWRQGWQGATVPVSAGSGSAAGSYTLPDRFAPLWLLRPPRALMTRDGQPLHQGRPLQLLAGPQRMETGWWPQADRNGAAARDYFVAASSDSGTWLSVYRQRPAAAAPAAAGQWYLQGFYA